MSHMTKKIAIKNFNANFDKEQLLHARNEMVMLKKRRMEIRFTPISKRERSFVSELRKIKTKICSLKIQLKI